MSTTTTTTTTTTTCVNRFALLSSSSCRTTRPLSRLAASSSSSSRRHHLPRRTRPAPAFSSSVSLSSAASATSSSTSDDDAGEGERRGRTAFATSALILLDATFRCLFSKYSIPFPSSLAGCGALFAIMISLDGISGGVGDDDDDDDDGEGGERTRRRTMGGYDIYRALNPGATLLARWLPVFFVPSLITLPLASGLGNIREVLKVLSVIVGGFVFTLFTTAWSVLGIRKLMAAGSNGNGVRVVDVASTTTTAAAAGQPTPTRAFGDALFRTLTALAWITGISAVRAIRSAPSSRYVAPLRSSFLLFATLSSFVCGANMPRSFAKAVHPLVTCTCLTWLSAKALAVLTGSTFLDVLRSYRSGTLSPLSAGPGDALLFLLGPAVVALACQMYGRRGLMRENVPEVAASTAVSSVGGLYGTAAMVRLLRIVDPTVRLSLLSRNITSPLAMAIASILGANASLAVTMVVVTGLFGANFGASILDAFGIKDPVARGLGIGAAAHGLGTAAFANEGDAFPFAAISMALTASACTVLISLPLVRKSILMLALG
ncbi:hypothetical protein ACHAW5_002705 [Stephanodiscus triporus]|uniref:Plastidal glycolate/glycerate translocator 1, chloroplastic n=1 Tax=Stephanodiscus triporus TaxID=2934178 RepID=A0ABD3MI71_9STRA